MSEDQVGRDQCGYEVHEYCTYKARLRPSFGAITCPGQPTWVDLLAREYAVALGYGDRWPTQPEEP